MSEKKTAQIEATDDEKRWFEDCLIWARQVTLFLDGEDRWVAKEITQRMEVTASKVTSGRPVVMLTGEFSAGKTSLLNALLRRPRFLPVGLGETTAVPVILEYSPKQERELQLPLARGYGPAPKEVAERFFTLRPDSATRDPLLAHLLENNLPARVLTREIPPSLRHVSLLDMPGLGSIYRKQDASAVSMIAQEFRQAPQARGVDAIRSEAQLRARLREASIVLSDVDPDVILFVCDARAGLDRVSLITLEALIRVDEEDEVLVVLNKADLMSPRERQEQATAARRVLSERRLSRRVKVLGTSALKSYGLTALRRWLRSAHRRRMQRLRKRQVSLRQHLALVFVAAPQLPPDPLPAERLRAALEQGGLPGQIERIRQGMGRNIGGRFAFERFKEVLPNLQDQRLDAGDALDVLGCLALASLDAHHDASVGYSVPLPLSETEVQEMFAGLFDPRALTHRSLRLGAARLSERAEHLNAFAAEEGSGVHAP